MKVSVLFTAALVAVSVMVLGFASVAGARSPELGIAIQERNLWGLLDRARADHRQLQVLEAKGAMSWQDDLLIVDVREPTEFRAGHIPGAVNIPRGLLEFRIAEVAKETIRPILVYCKEGLRSALAGSTLRNLGYVNVSNLAGGWEAWARYKNQMAEVPGSFLKRETSRPFWE